MLSYSLIGDYLNKFVFFLILMIFPIFVYADSSYSNVVMEISSGRILYSKRPDQPMLIASITKIMTCIVVLENSNLDEQVTVGEEVLNMYGTSLYLKVGEVLTVRDLLYGLMLRSGNDAAIVLAFHTAGSEEKFVQKMNQKAQEIGMSNTTFQNSHGLDDETKNYSTAYDMALLSQYAYHNSIYQKIVRTKKYQTKSSLKSYIWYNRMSLLRQYDFCIGGKNGYTPKAGKTLVSLAQKNGMTLTIVSIDDSNIYDNHRKLYEKYFARYQIYKIISKDFFPKSSHYYLKRAFSYPLKEDEKDYINTFLNIGSVRKNRVVGNIKIQLYDKTIGNISIYEKKQKKEKKNSFFSRFNSLIRS